MLRHLQLNDNNPDIAFSPDGIERMNQNMNILNDGKGHQPIYKVRTYEKAEKFAVGEHGNKVKKFVEAAKGTNLFFAVYESIQEDEATGKQVRKRTFATIPLNEVIKRKNKDYLLLRKIRMEICQYLFYLLMIWFIYLRKKNVIVVR